MKNKIVGITICILLFLSSTTLAVTPFNKDEQQTNHRFMNTSPIPLSTSGGWMKTFGGKSDEDADSVQQTTDGGYIITGYTSSYSAGKSDVWLIKIDNNGNEVWNKTFGGLGYDWGRSVQQTMDGGYIIVGTTGSFGNGWSDFWLIKTDDTGNEEWNKTFGGLSQDEGRSVQQTTDGGYILTGFTCSNATYEDEDVWLIKTDTNGNRVWDKTFGGEDSDEGNSVQQTLDGGYIITGLTTSFGNLYGDVWLIKTDKDGNENWKRIFGGGFRADGYFVEQTSDGGYIITGYGEKDTISDTVWLIKTDSMGNKEWDRTFVGSSGTEVHQTSDGGYIITGFGNGKNTLQIFLIKTDSNGEKIWEKTFGGVLFIEMGLSVIQTEDGGYIIAGTISLFFNRDIYLIKTDSQGKSKITALDNLLFEPLFQRFPHAFPILRHILGY